MKSRILTLASDTLVYGIFIIVGRFLTFMLTPFYTNFLSVEEVGDVGNFFSLIAFMNVLYSIGMDTAYFRFYSQTDQTQSRTAFTFAYLSILIASSFATVALLVLSRQIAPVLTQLPNGNTIVQFAILIPLTDTLMVVPYAYLRMTRQVWKFSVVRFILILIAVGLNILFVVILRYGIVGVFVAQLIANCIGLLILLPIIFRQFGGEFNSKLFRDMLKFGLPTVPATFSGIVLQVVDRPILKYLTNATQVGIYMVNYRLAIPMMLFVAMYDYAWRPFYLSHYESSDAKQLFSRILTYFFIASAVVFLCVGFFMDFVVRLPFFGGKFIEPSYWQGMDIIPIVMLGYIFNGFYINFTAGINIQKVTKYLPLSIGAGAIVNVLINFISIPILGYRGAAWATLFAYLASAVIVYYYSQRVYPIDYQWKKIFLVSLLMSIIYFVFYGLTTELELLPKFLIRTAGLILFLIMLFVVKVFEFQEISMLKGFFQPRKNKSEKHTQNL